MKIIDVPVSDLRPYANNPRDYEAAVPAVLESIKNFGFKVPLVIDQHQAIVCGHTRHEAAKRLGLLTVPCIVADDLTDEQIKAFRLADNRVAEMASWDVKLLDLELLELEDMSKFGFVKARAKPGRKMKNERERTGQAYNLSLIEPGQGEGFWEMPRLLRSDHVPEKLIGFNYVLTSEDYEAGVHFYLDDYQFERLWNNPVKYIGELEPFDCCLTPDFSLYMDMPRAMKLWNVYRSRLIGNFMQRMGLEVIPTLSWAEPETFRFCFDGIEPGGTVSVSTIGVKRDEDALKTWRAGMAEALVRLTPHTVLVYGGEIDFDYQGAKVVYFNNTAIDRMRGVI